MGFVNVKWQEYETHSFMFQTCKILKILNQFLVAIIGVGQTVG